MSGRLLIVEDDPGIAEFLVRGLREEGYQVEHAADGRDAWIALERDSWDAVLLDWWLPHEDGISILRRFRRRNRDTPVLLLTARDAIEQRVEGLDAGAEDYVCKPFSFEELLARVRALLRRKDQPTSLELEFGDISVNLASQRAARGGEPLELTNKEYSLLVFFMRHPETVLSRSRILSAVWDEHYDGLSNTLEVHVKELRRKLERFGPRVIHTRRGRGYVLSREGGESE